MSKVKRNMKDNADKRRCSTEFSNKQIRYDQSIIGSQLGALSPAVRSSSTNETEVGVLKDQIVIIKRRELSETEHSLSTVTVNTNGNPRNRRFIKHHQKDEVFFDPSQVREETCKRLLSLIMEEEKGLSGNLYEKYDK